MRTLISVLVLASLVGPSLSLGEPAPSVGSPISGITGSNTGGLDQPSGRPDPKVLDKVIGTWDVDYSIYDKQGRVKHYLGTATYQWILDGAAIQETWTSDYHGRKTQPYGTTIEFFDPARDHWTAIWIYPEKGMYYSLSGGVVEGQIVLTGPDQEGSLERWSTGEFAQDSFVGHFDISNDGGKTWRPIGINQMRRHRAH